MPKSVSTFLRITLLSCTMCVPLSLISAEGAQAATHTKKASTSSKKTTKTAKSTSKSSGKAASKSAAKPVICIPQNPTEAAFQYADKKDWENAKYNAKKTGNASLIKLISWMYLQDQDSRASFDEISSFIRSNAHWPQQQRLRLRAEQSLRYSDVSDATLEQWFAANPPVSGVGKIKLAELKIHRGVLISSDEIRALVKDGWKTGDFEEDEETRIATVYADILTSDDHIARTDRLLWEEKTSGANRMLSRLSEDQRKLTHARIALLDDTKDASFQLSHVPSSLLSNPGLIYARMMVRNKNGDDAGVREMLLSAPSQVPYPEKWWKLRESNVRKAVDDRNYDLASRLLANHGQVDGQGQADASWLSGWLSLQFLNNPQDAYKQFYAMYEQVKYPVSKARAAYWAGRAAEKAGDATAAKGWFNNAAQHPTTFYGQLAFAKMNPGKPLPIPSEASGTGSVAGDLIGAIRAAAEARQFDMATALANHLMDSLPEGQVAPLARTIAEMHRGPLAVRAAKRALQRGIILPRTGYPVITPDESLAVELPLALAISRQESEFDPAARSKAGALGTMQLLPGTAKEQAKKEEIPYSESKLTDISYNMRLGSAYLSRMVSSYDGSYVLGIAAYNAGPGNVRGWMRDFGTPGNTVDGALDWIEKIPFTETRNYVMRVMENLQVYRALTGGKTPPAVGIEQDLSR